MFDELTYQLADHLHQLPEAIRNLPMRDFAALSKAIHKRREEDARFIAALHGAELK